MNRLREDPFQNIDGRHLPTVPTTPVDDESLEGADEEDAGTAGRVEHLFLPRHSVVWHHLIEQQRCEELRRIDSSMAGDEPLIESADDFDRNVFEREQLPEVLLAAEILCFNQLGEPAQVIFCEFRAIVAKREHVAVELFLKIAQ